MPVQLTISHGHPKASTYTLAWVLQSSLQTVEAAGSMPPFSIEYNMKSRVHYGNSSKYTGEFWIYATKDIGKKSVSQKRVHPFFQNKKFIMWYYRHVMEGDHRRLWTFATPDELIWRPCLLDFKVPRVIPQKKLFCVHFACCKSEEGTNLMIAS